jgi:hypothetical protein
VIVDLDFSALLYAHATLCERAKTHSFGRVEAATLCDALNEFQFMLLKYMRPDACDFQVVVKHDYFVVEPIGGWD